MILEEIKKQTSENHHRLEQTNLLHPIATPSLTAEHYHKILRVFYGYFSPLEKEINKMELIRQYLPDVATRRKASMLKADLLNLNAIKPADTLALCQELPEIRTSSQAFGCLYVLEGSTLGGRMIAKSLRKNLSLDHVYGASFFNGYGQETGSKWKTFQQALLNYSLNFSEDREVIKSANDTFHKFEVWINNN